MPAAEVVQLHPAPRLAHSFVAGDGIPDADWVTTRGKERGGEGRRGRRGKEREGEGRRGNEREREGRRGKVACTDFADAKVPGEPMLALSCGNSFTLVRLISTPKGVRCEAIGKVRLTRMRTIQS